MKADIKLGNVVRDLVSGLEGTATSRLEKFNGNVQYIIQPKSTEPNKVPDGWSMDEHQLEVVNEGIAGRGYEAIVTNPIRLGAGVIDKVTGAAGIATERVTSLNGCIYYVVHRDDLDKDGKELPAMYYDQNRFEETSDGLIEEEPKPEAVTTSPVDTSGKAPGGPMSKARINP